jgi:hypothetical protein
MRADVHRDLTASSQVFLSVVWPAIRPMLGGGRIRPVEGAVDKSLEHDLDTLAGIDGFQMLDRQGVMRGIASRVQWIRPGMQPYRTFTIRVKRPSGAATEGEKRLHAIEHQELGFLFPNLTIQAYVSEPFDDLLSVGIIHTRDLFTCFRDYPSGRRNRAGNGGEEFEIYSFDYLRHQGYDVREWIPASEMYQPALSVVP